MSNERKQLHSGRDLSGWQMAGPGEFVVEDGALVSRGGMGLLWYTPETFGDCLLHVEYRVGRVEDNSGVFIRIADRPPDAWFAVHHGYEVQILATGDEWHKTGCIYSLSRALAVRSYLIKQGVRSTRMDVRALGNKEADILMIPLAGHTLGHCGIAVRWRCPASAGAEPVEVTLNGTLVTQFDPAGPLPEREFGYEPERGPRPQAGYIGLQNHDDASRVAFREVSVAPLS